MFEDAKINAEYELEDCVKLIVILKKHCTEKKNEFVKYTQEIINQVYIRYYELKLFVLSNYFHKKNLFLKYYI